MMTVMKRLWSLSKIEIAMNFAYYMFAITKKAYWHSAFWHWAKVARTAR
jgi:hypothetical protein